MGSGTGLPLAAAIPLRMLDPVLCPRPLLVLDSATSKAILSFAKTNSVFFLICWLRQAGAKLSSNSTNPIELALVEPDVAGLFTKMFFTVVSSCKFDLQLHT